MTPLDHTHSIDRLNYPGGDNGYTVPIGKCPRGTIMATFSAWSDKAVEREPMSRITRFDTGEGWPFIDSVAASGVMGVDWVAGHQPKLGIIAADLPTVPLFIDDKPLGVLPDARIELHETVVGRVLYVETAPLVTGQRGRTRRDSPTATGNAGDSGVPRFVQLPDGTIAFLGQEIGLMGTASNYPVYWEMLNKIPGATWDERRWGEVAPPKPEPEPEPEPEPLTLEQRVERLEAEVFGA